jgi:hypothetical protein
MSDGGIRLDINPISVRTNDFGDGGNTDEFGEAKHIANTVLFKVPDIRPSQSPTL